MTKETTLYQDNRILLTINKENQKVLTHENLGDFQMCFDNKKNRQKDMFYQHSILEKGNPEKAGWGLLDREGKWVSSGSEDICKMMKTL